MVVNGKQKGKRGELELVHELKDYGYDCRRSEQYCGKAGDADVIGLAGIHIECKRVEALNVDKAIDQAISDAKNGDIPAVFHRKDRRPWLVTVRIEDFMKMYHLYHYTSLDTMKGIHNA